MSTNNSILRLTGVGIPPYSARGIIQTLAPIQQASAPRRTVNGELVEISSPTFQKYATSLTGNDVDPPSIDTVWSGKEVTVDCIVELAQALDMTEEPSEPEDVTESFLGRPAVPGTVRLADGFVYYRPRLTMMVISFSIQRDEYQAITGWTMELEEK